jgi:Ca2+-dependent lipid-binding protein
MADYGARTSDPFLHARFLTSTPSRHKEDPPLTFRTQTRHRTVEPTWDASWVLANVPSSGFTLKVHVFDEDPDDHDDRLGSLHIHEHRIDEGYKGFDHRSFELKKRSASWRAYAIRWVAVGCGKKEMHAKVLISIENLGKTEAKDGRVHTVGPREPRSSRSTPPRP